MDADLDTLGTALYVRVDDLLKSSPEHAPARPKVGITPKISDAELVTLSVMQALLGHTSEARWRRFACGAWLPDLFPYLPKQPGYNKRLRSLAGTMYWLIGVLARDTSVWTDDVWVIDRDTQIMIGDKNYFGADFEATLPEPGSNCSVQPAKEKPNDPAPGSSNPYGEPSNRSTTRQRRTRPRTTLRTHPRRRHHPRLATHPRPHRRHLATTRSAPIKRSLTAYDH